MAKAKGIENIENLVIPDNKVTIKENNEYVDKKEYILQLSLIHI